MLSQAFIEQMKERLEAEKQEVESKIAELRTPEPPMDNPDMDDLANDATQDILEESMLKTYEGLRDKIDAALQRIEDGAYGICVNTGQAIPQETLAQEPWAAECPPTSNLQ